MSTIRDVAKLAGVSPSTVSRALSGKVFVDAKTKEIVMHAAEKLNYTPNHLGRPLHYAHLNAISFIIPDINSLFYPTIIKSIELAVAKFGYMLLLNTTNNSEETERNILDALSTRAVSGILCMSATDNVQHLRKFKEQHNIPVVLINRDSMGTLDSVSLDEEYGGYLMTKYLLDRGHTKIAGMFGNFEKQRFRARYIGCKKALEEYQIHNFKDYFIYDVTSVDEACRKTIEMLKSDDPPTAFFASIDMFTLGIYSGISHCGLRIPEDISVVGFDNLFITEHMIPPLTTFDFPLEEVSDKAVKLLLDQLGGSTKVVEEIVRGTIVERESVKKIN